jgi:hypothetical protein
MGSPITAFPISTEGPTEIPVKTTPLTGSEPVVIVDGGDFKTVTTQQIADRAVVDAANSSYDIPVFFSGIPIATDRIRVVAVRACTIYSVANLPASVAHAAKSRVAATASVTVTINKNGSSVGTVVFSASGTVGAFTIAADIVLAAGDVLEFVMPATPDTTIADVAITLAGHL